MSSVGRFKKLTKDKRNGQSGFLGVGNLDDFMTGFSHKKYRQFHVGVIVLGNAEQVAINAFVIYNCDFA
jgi:hypothetical protein